MDVKFARIGFLWIVVLVMSLIACGRAPAAVSANFVGDFETGNFDQWPICQNVTAGSEPCASVPDQGYSMQVENTVVRQGRYAARFEVRQGDKPLCCGDRAEVSGEAPTGANEGDERWYQWSTMFDNNFPADQGWSVVSQWHAGSDGSPPLSIVAGPTAGQTDIGANRWGVMMSTWNSPGDAGPTFTPWSAPLVRGVWNDIKLHVKWSASDKVGYLEFWLNGAPQTFGSAPCAGQTRCAVRTLMPGGGGVYFKQGYYRSDSTTSVGVVYHDGFSVADTEAALAPL
jgi:Polysaccharide lyase